MTTVAAGQANHLLSVLPEAIHDRWLLEGELVQLQQGEIVHELGETPREVYFPTTAIVSILLGTENGASIEIAHVGIEGIVGVALFMGGGRSLWRAVVQHPGSALKLRAKVFKSDFDKNPFIQHSTLRYTHALISQMGQAAVCSRHHKIQQQLSRWLLHSVDRLAGLEIDVTHEFISKMLGVRREGITEAVVHLQSMGLIKGSRGRIEVIDREGLEKTACECYSTIKREYDTLAAKR